MLIWLHVYCSLENSSAYLQISEKHIVFLRTLPLIFSFFVSHVINSWRVYLQKSVCILPFFYMKVM